MSKNVVEIEYPRHHETIASENYTFRIMAMPGAKKVEISINESAWKTCRSSGDSWFYDWTGYAAGEYEIAARVQLGNGHYHATERRFFTVEFSKVPSAGGKPCHGMTTQYVVVAPEKPETLRQLTSLLSREGVNVDSLFVQCTGGFMFFRFLAQKENALDYMVKKLQEKGVCMKSFYGTSYGQTAKAVLAVDNPERAECVVKELDQRFAAAEA
jgi:hypothetical protein